MNYGNTNQPFSLKPPSFDFFNRGSNGQYTQNASPIPSLQPLLDANTSYLQSNNMLSTPATSGFNLGQSLWGTGPGAKGSGLFGGDAGLMNSFSQQTNADGSTYGNWGGMGLGLAQAGYGIYSGMQNNKRADKMMDWSQERHNMALDSYKMEKGDYYANQSQQQKTRNIDNPNSVPHDQYMQNLGAPNYRDKAYS